MNTAHPQAAALDRGLTALDLSLAASVQAQLLRYIDELRRWNAAYNLTAVRDPHEMVARHLLDSLAIVQPLRALGGYAQRRVLDVGSGAGLPGLLLAMVEPEVQVTVLDSNGKKARFMRHVVRTLALDNVEVAEARVESWSTGVGFGVITSRAFSALDAFFRQTAHLLAPGGQWAAMKGRLDHGEQAQLPPTVHICQTLSLQVPGLDEARHLIIAEPAP
ncbi:16S rRNA (guanine(527)-N(7))-methyltransferase RsmG [Sinimarinibacterium sp. NLF-5-8]|uniref:16S rRNA (guanine(527)-N(7))-methyltransferase RsmG n=1 Tax=Sinimarinibacterium sp. NLF-5-8 TaxID=2698684 RepID=UPI00137BDDEA|nr:16S rRNA (guanine(527)-N(7))-methyltransferase RsmG [Sinimarinibacterium sp. NLF-5-8]QHS10400.1 16S rRNA (guanine(527)-N(7))-methyltransferase RsmG [Sinimarinibacterium sp. NLF-5-8]